MKNTKLPIYSKENTRTHGTCNCVLCLNVTAYECVASVAYQWKEIKHRVNNFKVGTSHAEETNIASKEKRREKKK